VLSADLATIIAGVAFTDDSTGYVPAGVNGVGEEVLKTEDGGKTWKTCPREGGFLLLSIAAYGENAMISGAVAEEYSDNAGASFNSTQGGDWDSQCVREDPEHDMFFVVGQSDFSNANGVGVSHTHGASLKGYHAEPLFTWARYGAFPTPKTWFISAGEWPEDAVPTGSQYRRMSQKILLERNGDTHKTYLLPRHPEMGLRSNPTKPKGQGYMAQIVKSSDGGATWTSVFAQNGTFYFNGIDCSDETHCVAVGESDDGAAPGARIYTTQDGGATWNRTAWFSGPQFSLMDVKFVGPKEAWAVGGDMQTFTGFFLHTTDGGLTWDQSSNVDGVYANSLSFPLGASRGYAGAFTSNDQSSVLVYE
jgi:hypothetical protein